MVSELFNASGTVILDDMFHCRRPPWFDMNTYVTLQHRPSAYQIKYCWQRLLRQFCSADGSIAQSMDLGPFVIPGRNLHLRRSTYMKLSPSRIVYHWRNDAFWQYQSKAASMVYYPVCIAQWEDMDDIQPIDATLDPITHALTTHTCLSARPTSLLRSRFIYIEDYFISLPRWERELLYHAHYLTPLEYFVATIRRPCALIIAADGSHRGHAMTFGTVLSTLQHHYITLQGHGYGTPSAHRAEAWAILAGSRLLLHIKNFHGVRFHPETTIEILSDNAGLITRLNSRKQYQRPYPNATLPPDWDLTEQIHSTLQDLQHPFTYDWIRGHQDRITPYYRLPIPAQANVTAHYLARDYMQTTGKPKPLSPLLPAARCTLEVGNETISGHYVKILRDAFSFPLLQAYLANKHSWSPSTSALVDWELLRCATQLSTVSRTRLTKLVYDLLPTRYVKSKAGSPVPPTCHYCNADDKFLHLVRCPNSPHTHDTKHALESNLRLLCTRHQAPLEVTSILITIVQDWFWYDPPLQQQPTPPAVHSAISQQHQLGWDMWMKGFFTKRWSTYITSVFQRRDDNYFDCQRFLAHVIVTVWQSLSNAWEKHLSTVHGTETSHNSSETLLELRTRIKNLHERRHDVLAAHRPLYFHENIDAFLLYASVNQLRTFLDNYEKPILQSAAQAKLIYATAPRLFDLPGFVRRPALHPRTTVQPRPQGATNYPHKHSRWKPSLEVLARFRTFFSKPPS